MSDAECGNNAGFAPSGAEALFEASIGTDISNPVLRQPSAESDGKKTLDLIVDDPGIAFLEQPDPRSTIITLATAHLRSPHSRRAYRQALAEFMDWCECTGTAKITKATVYDYIGELNHLRMSPATVNLTLCAIRRLVSELADRGLMSTESAARIMRIKGPRRKGVRLGNWLNIENAERLVRAPDGATSKGKRDRALLAVLLAGGVRRCEAAQLSVVQIQRREDRWVIVDLIGKHGRVRSVPIPAWAKKAIDEWVVAADLRSDAIFRRIDKAGRVHEGAISVNAIYQIVREYSSAIGVAIAPHDMRRTFAKLAHQGKASLDQIQLALGHSSILTTEIYLGIQQNLRDAPCDHLGLAL